MKGSGGTHESRSTFHDANPQILSPGSIESFNGDEGKNEIRIELRQDTDAMPGSLLGHVFDEKTKACPPGEAFPTFGELLCVPLQGFATRFEVVFGYLHINLCVLAYIGAS